MRLTEVQKCALRFARYSELGDAFYVEKSGYQKGTIDALTRGGYLHDQRVISDRALLTKLGVDEMKAIQHTCVTCGAPTDIAMPGGHSKCPKHCEDHEFEYDTAAAAWLCIQCGGDAPADFHLEVGGLEPGQTEIQ